MIKKTILFLLYSVLTLCYVGAQNREIVFEHSKFEDVLVKASSSERLVFIDCYTVWCGPCKNMAKYVFTNDTVADFFNSSFLNMKMDMETETGKLLEKKYNVESYPTYLFLNGKGDLIYKFVGGMLADEFIQKAKESLNPLNKVRVMNNRYKQGDCSDEFIREYIKLKLTIDDKSDAQKIAAAYFNKLSAQEKAKKENWFLFGESDYAMYLSNVNSVNINYLTDHWKDFLKENADSVVFDRISSNFRTITEWVCEGWYFKDFGRHSEQFDGFKKQIEFIPSLPDQGQFMVMMDLAQAICQNDTLRSENILAKYIGDFSAENQAVLFPFLSKYTVNQMENNPQLRDIAAKVIYSGRNKNLISYLKSIYGDQLPKPGTEKFDVPNLEGRIGQTSIIPFFHPSLDICWYALSGKDDKTTYYSYSLNKGRKLIYNTKAIDSLLMKRNIDPSYVYYTPAFDKNGIVAKLQSGADVFFYHDDKKELIPFSEPIPEFRWGKSPNNKYELFVEDRNLYLRQLSDSVVTQLSFDGAAEAEYEMANVEWIGNDGKFYVMKNDMRGVGKMSVIYSGRQPVSQVETYNYELPGDSVIARQEIYLGDVNKASFKKLDTEKWKGQQLSLLKSPDVTDRFFFLRQKRTRDEFEVCAVNSKKGTVQPFIHEVSKPYVNEILFNCKVINKGSEFLLWSDRSGWGHYYRYDKNGKLLNQLTKGNWTAGKIIKVDEDKKQVFLNGYGHEKDRNPNYTYCYRVNLDGTQLKLLTPENADHSVFIHPNGNLIIDNFSRIDTLPQTAVRNADGDFLATLEKPDVSGLLDYGWKYPEQFKVKAADNKTDLYGIMWKPYNFDSHKKYPIISQVYPGPQTETVWTDFTVFDRYNNTALAQRGFIVVCMGHRGGSPYREKAYATYGYGNLRDYALEDDKYGIEQLARTFSFIDSTKVGIVGHSGGGLMSVVAMCTYPDFYKVAVASSGNYDNNIYNRNWGEMYQGIGEDNSFVVNTAMELADNLKGKLLLVTGEVDKNVNPTITYRMVDAFINANKDFDLLVLPGQNHHYEGNYKSYFERRKRDFFTRYLLLDNQ